MSKIMAIQVGDHPEAIAEGLKRMSDVFKAKGHDYTGDAPWDQALQEAGQDAGVSAEVACEIQIGIKQARLRTLRRTGEDPLHEAIADSLLDRAVYALMALALAIQEEQA